MHVNTQAYTWYIYIYIIYLSLSIYQHHSFFALYMKDALPLDLDRPRSTSIFARPRTAPSWRTSGWVSRTPCVCAPWTACEWSPTAPWQGLDAAAKSRENLGKSYVFGGENGWTSWWESVIMIMSSWNYGSIAVVIVTIILVLVSWK